MQAQAQAQPNIALVKYWGKRDARLNLPATGSLSITLESLWTRTCVTFDATLPTDTLSFDGRPARAAQTERVRAVLDDLRGRAGSRAPARVETTNNFPTGAGLASSASGFAALVVAAARALGLALTPTELSRIARRGSGSAARSIFGGFVEMTAGVASDGSDAHAHALLAPEQWPLEIVIAITSAGEKEIGSTEGMTRTALTSAYYDAWVRGSDADLAAARDAVASRDFEALAAVSERSCLKMHALALSAEPGIVYWHGATVEAMRRVRELRRSGSAVFFTIDAGPQLKAVCQPADARRVAEALREIPGVAEVLQSPLGAGARLLEPTPLRASA